MFLPLLMLGYPGTLAGARRKWHHHVCPVGRCHVVPSDVIHLNMVLAIFSIALMKHHGQGTLKKKSLFGFRVSEQQEPIMWGGMAVSSRHHDWSREL